MTDRLSKILAYNKEVRIIVVEASETVRQAAQIHGTWHTATAAFGRTLVATLLLGSNLKGRGQVSVMIEGEGPVGRIVAETDGQGHVRGYLNNPEVALPLNKAGKLDVAGAIGLPGVLSVKKQMAGEKAFVGQVNLISGELGEDFTYYMAVSEQTPSSIGLSVLVNPDESVQAAGGFMVQVMPDAQEETIQSLETAIESLGQLAPIFESEDPLIELLQILSPQGDYQILDQQEVAFSCPCSKEKFGQALSLLSVEDLRAMIDEDQGAETVCHYCKTAYQFSKEELEAILAHKKAGSADV